MISVRFPPTSLTGKTVSILRQCQSWKPDPPTASHLDHLFVTALGMLDIPPDLTGTYAQLRPGASPLAVAGVPVLVCAPEDVLAHLPRTP